jgi:IS4 transposase
MRVIGRLSFCGDRRCVVIGRLSFCGDRRVELWAPLIEPLIARLRRIVTRCERGEMVLLTTHFDLSAAEVCALYQQRWIIEIFFRWLKSNVNLKRPLGYGPEPAMDTVFAALAAYCLALLLADWELNSTTRRPVPRIARSMQTIRARLYERVRTAELEALKFS